MELADSSWSRMQLGDSVHHILHKVGCAFTAITGTEKYPNSFIQSWFQSSCLAEEVNFAIANLGAVLAQWKHSSNPECRLLLKKFNNIYSVSTRHASLILPTPLQNKVKKWLGNDEKLFQEIYNQEVIHIVNKFTREHTIFNPLRDKRPVIPPEQSEVKYFEDILKETASACDFCNFKE
ncbi:hypothetical protein BaRGS_00014835 [Batillaria attramentaria]|uniref:Uncharacterized protein n=1 Tax=Batillaria attramentaria TaxID=370345 RepID=A0ABD0L3Z7_9CAEN